MSANPFKFGTVVSNEFFTNRREEIRYITEFLNSPNHLLISSPRRFGKTSLILTCLKEIDRPYIYTDLQLITSIEDFASQLLRRVYHRFPAEKIKSWISHFRILPQVNVNPLTNDYTISFSPASDPGVILEDVFDLIQKITKNDRLIFILDEFQEIRKIAPDFDKKLRALMQQISNINYIFLGSKESLIRNIFTDKKSPFYHFAELFQLAKIPKSEWMSFLSERFQKVHREAAALSENVLNLTGGHPYYTQHLASAVYQLVSMEGYSENCVQTAFDRIVEQHDNDFERLWMTFNATDKKLLLALVLGRSAQKPLSESFQKTWNIAAQSTVYSALKKLSQQSYLIHSDGNYELEDPFFNAWIIRRRNSLL